MQHIRCTLPADHEGRPYQQPEDPFPLISAPFHPATF